MSAGGQPQGPPRYEQWGEFRVLAAPIGSGLTSKVHLAERNGAPYALKRYSTGAVGLKAGELALLKRGAAAELTIMQALAHEHIVRVHGEVDVGQDICLALDYAPGASAKARMQAPSGSTALLPLDVIAWVARDIARALHYLHGSPIGSSGPVVHRDIKPGNIVFTAAGVAQLTDFGSSKLLQDVQEMPGATPGVVTVAFKAPEMFAGATASTASDIWMYGATLLCLLTGEELAADQRAPLSFSNIARPWTLEDHVHCRLQGLNSDEEPVPLEGLGLSEGERGVWEAAPADLKDLIQGCLRKRPKDRLSAEGVLAHPFVAAVEGRFSPRRPTPQLEWLPQWPFSAPHGAKASGSAATPAPSPMTSSVEGGAAAGASTSRASALDSSGIRAAIAELKEAYAEKYRQARELNGPEDFPLTTHADVLAQLTSIADANGSVEKGSKKLLHDFAAKWKALKVSLDDAVEEEDLARQRAQQASEGRQRADIEAMTARVKALQPLWQPCENFGALDQAQHARGEQRLLEHLVLKVEAQGKQIEALMGLMGAPQPLRLKYPGGEGAKVLLAAGYTPLTLCSAGYSVAEMHGAGCPARILKASALYTLVRVVLVTLLCVFTTLNLPPTLPPFINPSSTRMSSRKVTTRL